MSGSLYRTLVENALDLVVILDAAGTIQYVNPATQRLLDQPPEAFIGRNLAAYLHPEDAPTAQEAVTRRLTETGPGGFLRLRVAHPDGSWRELEVVGQQVTDHQGTAVILVNARDITERVQAEDERRRLLESEQRARTAAQEALALREEFISLTAHELRNPLASLALTVETLVDLLGDQRLDVPQVHHWVERVGRQTGRLVRLADRLLNIAQLRAGTFTLQRQWTDVALLVRELVAEAQLQTNRHQLTVVAPPVLSAWVDPVRLSQVLSNLLENAIKYAPEGGPIDVEVIGVADQVVLSVRDRGIGIPPEQQARVFEVFVRVHPNGHTSGLGLGLHVCQQIVQLHGGHIGVDAPPGGGARMVVALPVGQADAGDTVSLHRGEDQRPVSSKRSSET